MKIILWPSSLVHLWLNNHVVTTSWFTRWDLKMTLVIERKYRWWLIKFFATKKICKWKYYYHENHKKAVCFQHTLFIRFSHEILFQIFVVWSIWKFQWPLPLDGGTPPIRPYHSPIQKTTPRCGDMMGLMSRWSHGSQKSLIWAPCCFPNQESHRYGCQWSKSIVPGFSQKIWKHRNNFLLIPQHLGDLMANMQTHQSHRSRHPPDKATDRA